MFGHIHFASLLCVLPTIPFLLSPLCGRPEHLISKWSHDIQIDFLPPVSPHVNLSEPHMFRSASIYSKSIPLVFIILLLYFYV